MALDPIHKRAFADSAPLFASAIPFGLVLGVAITESTMPIWLGWLTNIFIFAGAAQLATVTLAGSASWATLVITAGAINLRHIMYSAALAPRFADQPRWFRWIGPFFLLDQVFALTGVRTEMNADQWRRYYLSVGAFFAVSWFSVVSLGLVVGAAIPSSWRLDVAAPIMFAGMVVVGISSKPGWIAAAVGAMACFAGLGLPNNGGIFAGAIAGVIAGYIADRALGDSPETDTTQPDGAPA